MVVQGIGWFYRVIYAWLWRVLLVGRDGYLMNPALGVGERVRLGRKY